MDKPGWCIFWPGLPRQEYICTTPAYPPAPGCFRSDSLRWWISLVFMRLLTSRTSPVAPSPRWSEWSRRPRVASPASSFPVQGRGGGLWGQQPLPPEFARNSASSFNGQPAWRRHGRLVCVLQAPVMAGFYSFRASVCSSLRACVVRCIL